MTHVSGKIVSKLISVLICLYLDIVRSGDMCELRDSYQVFKCTHITHMFISQVS